MIDFEAVFREFSRDIRRLSWTHRIPGMDPDDVHSEMLICLWKATQSYSPGGDTTFAGYWWSIWLNRRKDLLRNYYASRRGEPVLTDTFPDIPYHDRLFPSINFGSWDERVVWLLLGTGSTAQEVQEYVSKRRYYQIIEQWRTEETRRALQA